jgi:hypothetical protein
MLPPQVSKSFKDALDGFSPRLFVLIEINILIAKIKVQIFLHIIDKLNFIVVGFVLSCND